MRIRRSLIGLVAALAALAVMPACAIEFDVANRYGEPVDRGEFTAHIYSDDASRLDCGYGVRASRAGNRVVLAVRRAPTGSGTAGCFSVDGAFGELAAGTYALEVRSLTPDETSYQTKTRTLVVAPIAGRCNAYPSLQPALFITDASGSSKVLKERIANDPAFAARLGNPTVTGDVPLSGGVWLSYPPLVDATYMMYALDQVSELASVSRNGYACFATSPPDTVGTFLEFHHAGLDHYFYTADAGEIAAIDAGKVGPWVRTGHSFRAVTEPGCIPTTSDTTVYRFYGKPGSGPASHFLTRDRAECGAVDRSGQWSFEGTPMWASPLGPDGTCAAPYAGSRVPLYRLWRPFGESNHRFTTDPAVVAEMKARGWWDEGIAMCVVGGTKG